MRIAEHAEHLTFERTLRPRVTSRPCLAEGRINYTRTHRPPRETGWGSRVGLDGLRTGRLGSLENPEHGLSLGIGLRLDNCLTRARSISAAAALLLVFQTGSCYRLERLDLELECLLGG